MSLTALTVLAVAPWLLAVAATLALIAWGWWPSLAAAWSRLGLPSLALVWPPREEAPTVALVVPLEVLAGWAEADPATRTDDLKEAA